MTLPVPMLGGSTKSFRIRLIDIGVGSKIPEDSDTLEKGKNEPSLQTISTSYEFGLDDSDSSMYDVTVIIGHFKDARESLLLVLRFHSPIPGAKKFGSTFYRYAKENLNVGKGFHEVNMKYFDIYILLV